MQIITNNMPRLMLYANELTDQERINFDYMEDIETGDFFRYKGQVYSLDEFIRTGNNEALKEWDGYSSDSFFSGVLIKLCDEDSDRIIVGTYYS